MFLHRMPCVQFSREVCEQVVKSLHTWSSIDDSYYQRSQFASWILISSLYRVKLSCMTSAFDKSISYWASRISALPYCICPRAGSAYYSEWCIFRTILSRICDHFGLRAVLTIVRVSVIVYYLSGPHTLRALTVDYYLSLMCGSDRCIIWLWSLKSPPEQPKRSWV